MAPARPFGKGFTSLDKRRSDAQSLLARAWRCSMARRDFATRMEMVREQQRQALIREQRRFVAHKLAHKRRAPVRNPTNVFGGHLSNLLGSLPALPSQESSHLRGRLISPILCEDSYSTRWLTSDPALIPEGALPYLSDFQQAEVQNIRCEYQQDRATISSHLHPTWTQVLSTTRVCSMYVRNVAVPWFDLNPAVRPMRHMYCDRL